jgi:hypothetical protein
MTGFRWEGDTLIIEGKVYIRHDGPVPIEVVGKSTEGGGTIYYVHYFSADPASCGEFTGSRARGTPEAPQDAQDGDEIVKYAGVARLNGVGKQLGFMQFEVAEGAGGRWHLALSPAGTDVPQSIVHADAEFFDVLRNLCIPHNTMFWGKTAGGGRLGMMFLDSVGRTSLQLNNTRLRLSDADTVTDAQGKITGIRAVVNGVNGTIPFVQD